MKQILIVLAVGQLSIAAIHAEEPASAAAVIAVKAGEKSIAVTLGGEPFTEFVFAGRAKPILYPIHGPGGVDMIRHYPMKPGVAGEATDHPHHESLWFTHGDVNGVDFWKVGEGAGTIVVKGTPAAAVEKNAAIISSEEIWKDSKGKVILTSATTVRCGEEKGDRFIDYAISLNASEGDVTFGDTKEGTMGIRSHPALNLKGDGAKGQALNSEGVTGLDIWGKHAKWVDYSGPVNDKVVGIAIFDHPSNLRHPTTWHARDYGLIAANPFGLHDFEKAEKGKGNHTIKKGESLTLSYRFLFHAGDAKSADIAGRYTAWASGKE